MEESLEKKSYDLQEFPPIDTATWEAVLEKDLKGEDYKSLLNWDTNEGIDALPFYRTENLASLSHELRAIPKSEKLPDQSWFIAEDIRANEHTKANQFALEALKGGSNALYFEGDLNLSTKEDISALLKDIIIEIVQIEFSSNLSNTALVKLFDSYKNEHLSDKQSPDVLFQIDPFAKAIKTGKLPGQEALSSLVNELCEMDYKSLCVQSSTFQNMGASIVDQLALALATGNEYMGMNESAAEHMYFNFAIGPKYFLEIAKLRSFRLMWKQVLNEYGKSSSVHISAETTKMNMSSIDIHNNILRATTEAMSAAVSEADSILIHPFDEGFEDASTFSQRISRNIQHLLLEESYLNKVKDPSGGSYYIEMLTDKLATAAWERFQEIEAKGGIYAILKSGELQAELKERQEALKARVENQEDVLVGINKFQPQNKEHKSYQDDSVSYNLELDFEEIETVPNLRLAQVIEEGA